MLENGYVFYFHRGRQQRGAGGRGLPVDFHTWYSIDIVDEA